MDVFRVRLNCIDSYQATPTEFDPPLHCEDGQQQRKGESKVPVIRVFGATETGQKVCAHIHGAFPYLYIEYRGGLEQDEVRSYIRRIQLSVDHALSVSYRRNLYDGKTTFVAHVSLVKGIPFYGYHVGYSFFLKIYLFNPLHMTRLADLLRQGAVMKRFIQPFESHLQYLLQWMCDYNLFGCAYIDCSTVKFRSPVPEYLELQNTTHRWHDRIIPESLISGYDKLPRQSHCSIEVDICVQNILNRLKIEERLTHHDFIERSKPAALDAKLVHSMAGLWRDETRRRKAQIGEMNPNSSPFPPEVLVSVSADPRNSQPGGWVHEEEYLAKMRVIAEEEREARDNYRPNFEDFIELKPLESRIQTAFESIEDLFPMNLQKATTTRETSRDSLESGDKFGQEDIEVDESRIVVIEDESYACCSDEELAKTFDAPRGKSVDRSEEPQANGQFVTTVNDEEARPHNDNYADTFEDPQERLAAIETHGQTSSAELEALGIRDTGDYSHAQDDAFEVLLEYTSDITLAVARFHEAKEPYLDRPKKRRKIMYDENFIKAEGRSGHNPPLISSQLSHLEQGASTDPDHLEFINEYPNDVKENYYGGEVGSQEQPRQGHSALKGSVQPVKGDNGGHNDLKGSFHLVKDPHDHSITAQLSQKSSFLAHNSFKSKAKNVSFDTSLPVENSSNFKRKEHSSGSSLHPKSNSSVTESIRTLPSPSKSDTSGVPPQITSFSSKLHQGFGIYHGTRALIFGSSPPAPIDVSTMMKDVTLPSVAYQEVFYSNEQDVPERSREYAGREFRFESNTIPFIPDFDATGLSKAQAYHRPRAVLDKISLEKAFQRSRRVCTIRTWEIGQPPPLRSEVQEWLNNDGISSKLKGPNNHHTMRGKPSQIDEATQRTRHGFKYSQKQSSTSVRHETQYMSLMSLEIHVNTRGNLVPNPEQDEIACIFWCVQSDETLEANGIYDGTHVGILVLSESGSLAQKISKQTTVEVEEESSELDLINRMISIVRNYDPDVLTGFEVHGGSWGYIIERARCKYDYNLCDEFSRMKFQSHGRFGKESDKWGFNQTSTIRITGRHMINIWRAMRGELNLLQYTLENIVFHVLHQRVPHFSFLDLTTWYTSNTPRHLAKVVDYFVQRVQLDLQILEQNELVPRTSEQARLLGVDFFSVFSRGSQFKVESLMFRIAKPENFLIISPSRKQVGQQNALECLPLVMEPQSAFYTSPLIVLDFQSLYPSVMIAYNYCYSTFLGRVVHWRGQNKMGFTDFNREPGLLELFKDSINIAPNGMMYVKPHIRKSLLAKMLGEILETRVMVKSGMKVDKDDKTLQRLLNNRQLALKLIANVTYGYTSASFSGRMPCSEIADSIVQTARETLEKSIALIHSVERWNAEVVYGDTDSLFVYLKGRTKDEAFDVGKEIAKTITDMNPRPVKLKFEKVYHPCVLLAKKRYVGFKYESKNQKEPEFDAKGIETVRRDGTPAEQKIEEKALKILFSTADLSQVKSYFLKQCSKIMRGKVSIQDFCFAREVKLGTYSDKGPPPPGALISTKRMLEDPRAEPQYGERVPYVVITGAPGARLIERCVAPDVLLNNDHNDLDAEYYISKNIIPPLERIFNLVGANVRQWYDEMPKYQRIRRIEGSVLLEGKDVLSKKTLESYMKSSSCIVCRDKLESELPICSTCLAHPEISLLTLRCKLNAAEAKAANIENICRSCAKLAWGDDVRCDSKDCPVYYTRTRHMAGLANTNAVTAPLIKFLEDVRGNTWEW